MTKDVKSGLLEFSDDQKVFVAVDEDDYVLKAVLIDGEGNESALGALPTDEQVQEAVDAWLDDHPEATTTVQDGAITTAKLANGSVTDDKLAADGIKAEVSDLKTDLDNKISLYGDSETYIDCLKTNDPDYLSGKAYSQNTGTIVSVSGCSISGYIFLSAGEKIIVDYELPNTGYAIKVAKYNTNKQWISTTIQIEQTTGSKTYEYTTDSNCYVRVQIWDANLPASIHIENFYKIRKEALNLESVLPNQIFNMYLSGELANLIDESSADFLRDKAYSSNTSNIVNFTGANISNYVFVPKGEDLHINYELPDVSYQIKYAVYDSSKVWIKTVPLSTSVSTGHQEVVYTADIDCYVRVQFYAPNQTITVTENAIRKFKGDLTTGTQYVNKKGVAFGTSLSYRAISSYGYLDYLPALCGAEIDNQGLGSSTILPHTSTTNMLANIKAYDDFADKDFCLFEGFVNDWYYNASSDLLGTFKDDDETTVCGCIRSAINYIRTQKPYITMIAILDHVGQNSGIDCSSTAENSGGLTQCEYYDTIAKVFDSLSIPVIPLYKMSQMNEYTPNYFVDNIHPSDLGAEHTAREIWYRMKDIPLN